MHVLVVSSAYYDEELIICVSETHEKRKHISKH